MVETLHLKAIPPALGHVKLTEEAHQRTQGRTMRREAQRFAGFGVGLEQICRSVLETGEHIFHQTGP